MLATRESVKSASSRRPQHEVPDDVAQESDFWKFIGTVAIPGGIALLVLAVGTAPRIGLHHDPAPSVQPSAGGSPVFDSTRERLQAVWQGALAEDPTLADAPPEQSPVAPFPVVPPSAVPAERPPPVTVERDEPPARIEPAPLPTDLALSVPLQRDGPEPDAESGDPPRDMAAVDRLVPPTPEPRMPEPRIPEPLTAEPAVETGPTVPPASPEPTPEAPVQSQAGPELSVSPEPEPPSEVERESSTPESAASARPAELRASPEPTPEALVESQPGLEQPASPRPRPPVAVALQPPPAAAAPTSPADSQPPPAPRSGSPAAEAPQLAMIRPGPAALLDQLLPPGRGSGHKLLARLEATASKEGCEGHELPFFRVIESDAVPARLPPGGRFSHRLVYALCPAGQGAQSTATVTRELRGGAEVVLVDQADGFRLRPGTWASDEEFAVPPNTDPGRYTVNTTVTFGGRIWTEQTVLLIE